MKRDALQEVKEIKSIGRKKGTNLKMLRLNRPTVEYISEDQNNNTQKTESDPTLVYWLVGSLLVLLLVIVGIAVYRLCFVVPVASFKETQL